MSAFDPQPAATVAIVPPPGPPMSDEAFRALRTLIYGETGIFFQDSKKYLLEGRLGKRLGVLGLSTFEEYLMLVTRSSSRFDELPFLCDAVTINETFFFRNEPQFEVLEKELVPRILAGQQTARPQRLRVWSAASSTGEEAYTVAMIYLEKIRPRYPQLEMEILGTDISPSVLETARGGVFRDYSVRNMPQSYLGKYLTAVDGRYRVRDDVRRLVRFDRANLIDRLRTKMLGTFDIIFCCNVLIYFDLQSKIQAVSGLFDNLNRGGFLFIGFAESLHGISNAFTLMNFPKTVAYRKD